VNLETRLMSIIWFIYGKVLISNTVRCFKYIFLFQFILWRNLLKIIIKKILAVPKKSSLPCKR